LILFGNQKVSFWFALPVTQRETVVQKKQNFFSFKNAAPVEKRLSAYIVFQILPDFFSQ